MVVEEDLIVDLEIVHYYLMIAMFVVVVVVVVAD
jgi:hypothetical protein